MCISNASAPLLWPDYDSQQSIADPPVLNSRAFARDEKLSKILNHIESKIPISQESIDSIEGNRTRKFRGHRKILLEKIAGWDEVLDPGDAAFENAVINERIEWVRENSTEFEFRCMYSIASGSTYEELATEVSRKPSTIRSIVSRCRTRLKNLSLSA